MQKAIPHIINGNGTINLLINGAMKPVDTGHINYEKIMQAIQQEQWDVIPDLVDIEHAVSKNIQQDSSIESDTITIKDGNIMYMGTVVENSLTRRIIKMIDQKLPIGYMVKFLENLLQNPSNRAVNELYDFLEAGNIPITENGTFMTYKKITKDYKDCFTKTIDNSIGATVEMPRNQVDDVSSRTCSHGLHVCSYDYLRSFGGDRVVLCEVNPKDVVSIPTDYNNTKMRVCRYKVIDEIQHNQETLKDTTVYNTTEKKDQAQVHDEHDESEPETYDSCPECGAQNRWELEEEQTCAKCDYTNDAWIEWSENQ